MRIVRNLLAVTLFTTIGLSASAEQRREVQLVRPSVSPAMRLTLPWPPAGATATRVIGTVVDVSRAPVSYAKVQLRNLGNGLVLATADANEAGEYAFDVSEPGTYVVEMLVLDHHVLALSNAVTLRRYETSRTLIRLAGRWDFASRTMFMPASPTAFFGMGAANSMTSSTMTLAAEADVPPVDAGEPVSPQ